MWTLLGPDEVPLLDQDVLGQIHVDRARAPGRRDVERLADDRAEIVAVLHQEVVLRCTDRVIPTLSASWNASLPMRCVGTWPVNATIGIESISASCSAVTRLVAAGPRSPGRRPTRPVRPRVALGRVPGGRLLADQDVAQALEVVQDVVDGQDRAAGQAEDQSRLPGASSTPERFGPRTFSLRVPPRVSYTR